jgi:hypothetical protein
VMLNGGQVVRGGAGGVVVVEEVVVVVVVEIAVVEYPIKPNFATRPGDLLVPK